MKYRAKSFKLLKHEIPVWNSDDGMITEIETHLAGLTD
jgi:hypothetical protein